ncbi:MAG: alpha/beta hydrolase-fold protein [Proteobacteria bacterium]|nr:alpha/beta hydrolase-fold protein [Pseudomonadota bacterium]
MKNLRNVFAISLLASLLDCQPAEVTEPVVEADDQIIIGHIDKLDSAALGEERDIWIYVPRGAETPENIASKYPVVYLLDGNGHFHSVTGMIKQLSTTNGNTISPQMIVVGIPNTDRFRDLTPTHVEGTSGGGDAFLDFIEHELVPYIEEAYPVSRYRTFIGHSLGGLMAIDALVTRPHLFDNYVAIDPSLWWDEQAILRKAEAALIERDFSGKSLYVAVANTMREGMSLGDVVDNTDESTLHIRSILQFSASAAAEQRNGLNFDWKYYDDDNHGSVPLIAEYDAIRFLFPWYQVRGINELLSEDSTATPDEVVNHITSHYANVSEHFAYTVVAPVQFVNRLGHAFLGNEKPDSAYALFAMNQKNNPDSPIVFDAFGDYYLAQENMEQAREYFSRAVALGGTTSQEKLDKLAADD